MPAIFSSFAPAASLTEAQFAARLARLRRFAWLLDSACRVPGTSWRFGLNGLLGLTPAVGDVLMGVVSLILIIEAWRLGAPRLVLARMLGNVAIETVVGAVPVLGDLFDVAFKANLRNLALLERYIATIAPHLRPR